MSTLTALSQNTFDTEVLQAEVPVLVDFGATWCPPCRRVAPEVEAVAAQMEGKVRVFTVDVDDEPDLAARYHVQGIPDLIIYKNGKVVDQLRGAHPRQVIAEKLQQYV